MGSRKLLSKVAVIALATAAAWSPASAQQAGAPGRPGLYVYHTSPQGGCPGLDWHLNIEKNGSIVGFVAWDRMRHMARLEGIVDRDGSFKMNSQDTATGKTATISGSAKGDYIQSSVSGSGTACDGKMLQIPRDEGGLEGGGG